LWIASTTVFESVSNITCMIPLNSISFIAASTTIDSLSIHYKKTGNY
jgi:hypothetical protein